MSVDLPDPDGPMIAVNWPLYHVVEADGQLADDAQVGRGVEQGGVHPVHDGGEDAVGVGGESVEFGRGRRRFVGPDLNVGHRSDDVQGVRQEGAGDQCFGA